MKKVKVFLLIAALFLVVLPSCNTGGKSNVQKVDFEGGTVKIWSQNQIDPRKNPASKSSPTYAEEVAKWNRIEKEFNCKIEVLSKNNFDNFKDDYTTAFTANTVIADAITGDMTMSYPTWMISGMLEPLDDYFDYKSEDSIWDPAASDNFMYNGKCYAVWIKNHTLPQYIMLFNKTLFETHENLKKYNLFEMVKKKEWTWDKLAEVARAATIDKNGDGKPDIMGLASRGQPGSFLTNGLIISNGCYFVKREGNRAILTLDSPEAIEALNFSYKLAWEDYSLGVTGVFDSWTGGMDEFKQSRVAILAAGTYDIIFNQEMDDEIGIIPFPIGPRQNDYIGDAQSFSFWGLVPGAKNHDKTAKLITALLTPDKTAKQRTVRDAYEQYVDNEESLDMIELMLASKRYTSYYGYKIMIDQFVWSDYGLRQKIPSATFIAERKAVTQNALDAIWQPLVLNK